MKRSIHVSDELKSLIQHFPPELKKKIRKALDEIAVRPSAGKELVEELAGLSAYRVGSLRIIYRARGEVMEIVALGPQKTIYQKMALELGKFLKKKGVRALSLFRIQ